MSKINLFFYNFRTLLFFSFILLFSKTVWGHLEENTHNISQKIYVSSEQIELRLNEIIVWHLGG